jgi:hypothetical protein
VRKRNLRICMALLFEALREGLARVGDFAEHTCLRWINNTVSDMMSRGMAFSVCLPAWMDKDRFAYYHLKFMMGHVRI